MEAMGGMAQAHTGMDMDMGIQAGTPMARESRDFPD
jgi:hypothetical protein